MEYKHLSRRMVSKEVLMLNKEINEFESRDVNSLTKGEYKSYNEKLKRYLELSEIEKMLWYIPYIQMQ